MAARVEIGRPFEHAHQQGRLGNVETVKGLIKEIRGGQAESVDRAIAVLAQVDFIEVGFEDLLFAVVDLQQHRHDHFGELSAQSALGGQIEILDELLGQGAAALYTAATCRLEDGPGNAPRVKAEVGIIPAVLNGDQGLDQMFGDIRQFHQNAIFVFPGIDAADQGRLQARQMQRFAAGVVEQPLYPTTSELDAQRLRLLGSVGEGEGTHDQIQGFAPPAIAAGLPGENRLAVVEKGKFGGHFRWAQAQPRVQLQRPGIDLCRQRKPFPFKACPHGNVQIDRNSGDN